jgi:hypothetical protein
MYKKEKSQRLDWMSAGYLPWSYGN